MERLIGWRRRATSSSHAAPSFVSAQIRINSLMDIDICGLSLPISLLSSLSFGDGTGSFPTRQSSAMGAPSLMERWLILLGPRDIRFGNGRRAMWHGGKMLNGDPPTLHSLH